MYHLNVLKEVLKRRQTGYTTKVLESGAILLCGSYGQMQDMITCGKPKQQLINPNITKIDHVEKKKGTVIIPDTYFLQNVVGEVEILLMENNTLKMENEDLKHRIDLHETVWQLKEKISYLEELLKDKE